MFKFKKSRDIELLLKQNVDIMKRLDEITKEKTITTENQQKILDKREKDLGVILNFNENIAIKQKVADNG